MTGRRSCEAKSEFNVGVQGGLLPWTSMQTSGSNLEKGTAQGVPLSEDLPMKVLHRVRGLVHAIGEPVHTDQPGFGREQYLSARLPGHPWATIETLQSDPRVVLDAAPVGAVVVQPTGGRGAPRYRPFVCE